MKTLNCSVVTCMSLLFVASSILVSCKKSKDPKPPTISFKTGGNYTSSNANVTTSDIITAGIIADKNESDLRVFTVYNSIGNDPLTVKNTYSIADSEKSHFEKDYTIKPSTSYGYETWKFEISDFDGNTNSVSFKLTVQ